jgi:hypothetical protein
MVDETWLAGLYSFIHGMQGDDEFRLAGAGPKHAFAYDVEQCRHGGVSAGVDCGNANVSQRDLTEFYYPVWEQVARANATSVMCSYSKCMSTHRQHHVITLTRVSLLLLVAFVICQG